MAIASLIIVIVDFETVEGIQFDGFVATFYETADRLVKLPIFKKVNGTFTYFYVFFFRYLQTQTINSLQHKVIFSDAAHKSDTNFRYLSEYNRVSKRVREVGLRASHCPSVNNGRWYSKYEFSVVNGFIRNSN